MVQPVHVTVRMAMLEITVKVSVFCWNTDAETSLGTVTDHIEFL